MNEPNKGWRESDAGKFFEKHKVPILVGAAIVLALSFWASGLAFIAIALMRRGAGPRARGR